MAPDISIFFKNVTAFGILEFYSWRIVFGGRKHIGISCNLSVYVYKMGNYIQRHLYEVLLPLFTFLRSWRINFKVDMEKSIANIVIEVTQLRLTGREGGPDTAARPREEWPFLPQTN